MIFYQNYKKDFVNPYRTGVLIGNYNEDLFGKELNERYKNTKVDPKNYLSESRDKFRWPESSEKDIGKPGNDMTMSHNSNFDLNIVLSNSDFDDYVKLYQKNITNPYILDDKNKYTTEELEAQQRLEIAKHLKKEPNLIDEIQKSLGRSIVKDTNGIFVTKKEGIHSHLIMGHGSECGWKKGEYSSIYNLTMSQKEPTKKIFDPKYQIKQPFMHQPKEIRDDTDWGFRKNKIVGEFTKKFDKKEEQ